ncbi:MAG: GNAT family N-acetyltransferase [Caldilineaceae bacterium]|nr:GNAT family N-acetyltransferase [Caldilineaceae bacterium]
MSDQSYPPLDENLGDGLLLRWATPDDAAQLVDFNSTIHGAPTDPATHVGQWTADLMRGDHPRVRPEDFTVVVDTNVLDKGRPKIVSTLVLLSEVWSYEEVEFGFGQPELVGTLADYRRRGLIRLQMEAIHRLSAQRGHLVQGITGNPWYYRQFGYEMTVNLGGARLFNFARPGNQVLKPRHVYTVRDAAVDDIPVLHDLYLRGISHSPLRLVRDEADWRYALEAASPESVRFCRVKLLENEAGEVVGYFTLSTRDRGTVIVDELACAVNWSLRDVALGALQWLKQEISTLTQTNADRPLDTLWLNLGEDSPVYAALGQQVERQDRPYNWYMRVPDLAAFLHHIAPVLERRLAGSVMAGHSGELKLATGRSRLHLRFEEGRLVEILPYTANTFVDADVYMPDETFLHILFQHRTLAELNSIRKDCFETNAEARVLINCLFPKCVSNVIGFI